MECYRRGGWAVKRGKGKRRHSIMYREVSGVPERRQFLGIILKFN
jgi:hypothetical protein